MYSAEEGALVLTKGSMLSVAGLARISMRSRFALVGATLDGFAKHFFSEQRTESCSRYTMPPMKLFLSDLSSRPHAQNALVFNAQENCVGVGCRETHALKRNKSSFARS